MPLTSLPIRRVGLFPAVSVGRRPIRRVGLFPGVSVGRRPVRRVGQFLTSLSAMRQSRPSIRLRHGSRVGRPSSSSVRLPIPARAEDHIRSRNHPLLRQARDLLVTHQTERLVPGQMPGMVRNGVHRRRSLPYLVGAEPTSVRA